MDKQYACRKKSDLLHLIENKFDRKRIYATPSAYPNSNSKRNPEAQFGFRTDEMTSFFDQSVPILKKSLDFSSYYLVSQSLNFDIFVMQS